VYSCSYELYTTNKLQLGCELDFNLETYAILHERGIGRTRSIICIAEYIELLYTYYLNEVGCEEMQC